MTTRQCLPMTLLVVAAFVVHCGVARSKSANLLEHDEAISLLVAAGKSQRVDTLYSRMSYLQLLRAADLQDLLHPTKDVRTRDVVRSLSQRDIHPPLYFLVLHGMGELGIHRQAVLRLLGTFIFFIAAWTANRWIWPNASPLARCLGTAWLLLTPTMVDIATELRQYAFVYLGVVVSIAALVVWWQQITPSRHAVMLLALGPVILLYSQFGTIIWVAVGLIAAIGHLTARQWRRWRLLACSVSGATILLLPLLLWAVQINLSRQDGPLQPIDDFYGGAFQPLCGSLAESWWLMPWRWRGSLFSPVMAALMLAVSALLAWRRGQPVDQVLWLAAFVWGGFWLAALTFGRIPPHAVEPKQLAPAILIPICLLVRAGIPGQPGAGGRIAVGVLAVSVIGLSFGTARSLISSHEPVLAGALREADCLIADAPRRGYLLPLAEKMKPHARIVIAAPETAIAQWPTLVGLLPDDRLLTAELGLPGGEGHQPDAAVFFDRLSRMYREVVPLWKGPRRTLTEFRHRGSEPPVGRESQDG